MKQPDKPDIMEVIIGDYSVQKLYGDILMASDMNEETEREIAPYFELLEDAGRNKNWKIFNQVMNLVVSYYPNYYPLYIKLAEILERRFLPFLPVLEAYNSVLRNNSS